MNLLYFIILISSVIFPIILSFDRKVAYYKKWLAVIITACFTAIPFIIWDSYFTSKGIWGFNDNYTIGLRFFGLPIEEILFFFAIPFCCIFIYECCKAYFGAINFKIFNHVFNIAICIYTVVLFFLSDNGLYTLTVVSMMIPLLCIYYLTKSELRYFSIGFCISLFPFLIVNGILTGIVTNEPIVWYNSDEFSGYRIITIPYEDVLYGFIMIFSNTILFEKIDNKLK